MFQLSEVVYGKPGSWKERSHLRLRCNDPGFWETLWCCLFPDLWTEAKKRGWKPDDVTLPLPTEWDKELKTYGAAILARLKAQYVVETRVGSLKTLCGGLHKHIWACRGHLIVVLRQAWNSKSGLRLGARSQGSFLFTSFGGQIVIVSTASLMRRLFDLHLSS